MRRPHHFASWAWLFAVVATPLGAHGGRLRSRSAPKTSEMVFSPTAEFVSGIPILYQAPRGTNLPRPGIPGMPPPTPSDGIHGIFVVFHSCGQQPRDLFEAPEERKMMKAILRRGFVVVAPEAQAHENPANCWRPLVDAAGITQMLAEFRNLRGLALLPMYGVGISSGGVLLGAMAYYGAPFAGCHIQVAPPQTVRAGMPPMSFTAMKYDTYGPVQAMEKAAEELKTLQVPVQVIVSEPKPIEDLESRLEDFGFPEDMVPAMGKMAEIWGFKEMKKDGKEYLALNTADQFLGRMSTDPNWAPILKDKTKFKVLFEELHVIEGVHGATAERFEESLDFLMDPSHTPHKETEPLVPKVPGAVSMHGGPTKPMSDQQREGSPAPVPMARTCEYKFPVGKTGLAAQRILRLPQKSQAELNFHNNWVTSKVDFLCACLKVQISDEPSSGPGPSLTWLNRTFSQLKTPLPGKPDLMLADVHDTICENEGKIECAQCKPWDPFGEKRP